MGNCRVIIYNAFARYIFISNTNIHSMTVWIKGFLLYCLTKQKCYYPILLWLLWLRDWNRDSAYAVPTNRNYATELPTFGVIAGVNKVEVQWLASPWVHRLRDHGENRRQVSMSWYRLSMTIFKSKNFLLVVRNIATVFLIFFICAPYSIIYNKQYSCHYLSTKLTK